MFRAAWVLTKQTFRGYGRANSGLYAAAIAYYVLFAIVPIAILAFSVFGLVLRDEGRRDEIVDYVLDQLPLTQTEGRQDVADLLDSVQAASGAIAIVGLVFALWTASSVFSAVRRALNNVWRVDEERPFAQGKLVDFLQIGLLSAILISSLVATGVVRAVREASAEQWGPIAGQSPLWEVPAVLIPAAVTFVTFATLYHIVPATRPALRDVLPGAVIATVLFELLKNSFAIYVANFNNYDVVYGSLAGIVLFLFYTYLSSVILLFGAEVAHTSERFHAGAFEEEIHPRVPGDPISEQALRALRGLFLRQ
ncbi:MAG: YihY/virulence factor BrkB family protein [Dehalococcoidia bacterium]